MPRRWILAGSLGLSKVITAALGLLSSGYLLLVTLRRWVFTVVALLGSAPCRDHSPECTTAATVLLLVPFRDEISALPALIAALSRLDYPPSRLCVVFVDDGSLDGSAALCRDAIRQHPNWYLLSLSQSVGKAAALNAALDRFSQGKFVAVFDADERPQPAALRALVAACQDPRVAAVSGRRALTNALASPTASYAAFENLLHQLLTQQAKDQLRLAPAILGSNCLYRREALEQGGAFRKGALLEDSDLTVRLSLAGWRTRFVPHAIAEHAAPQTLLAYCRQHMRWAGGFQDVAQHRVGDILRACTLPWILRLELLLFSLGYADRVALAVLMLLRLMNVEGKRLARVNGYLLRFVLVTPLLQVITALHLARAPLQLWLRLPLLPLFFIVDLAIALTGIGRRLAGKLPSWERRAH